MIPVNPLGDFLRARRAELAPEPGAHGHRRTPGLRREEIAQRAGVSVDYYTRIEQGRAGIVSEPVLRALATALELGAEQRAHLFATVAAVPAERLSGLAALLDVTAAPATVTDERLDLVASNALFRALTPTPPANLARFVFLDPDARELVVDCPRAARGTLTRLRYQSARHDLSELVAELSADQWFAAHWPDATMLGLWGGPGAFRLPTGTYEFELVTLTLPAYPDRTVSAYVPADARAREVLAAHADAGVGTATPRRSHRR